MVKLLIIADDFTGALDTGVQFAVSGAATLVETELTLITAPWSRALRFWSWMRRRGIWMQRKLTGS